VACRKQHGFRVVLPKIPNNVINSVVYLFRNREDALAGRNAGGKKDGGIDIIDLDPAEWTFLPG
jgi:hypothetical protein